MQDWIMTDDMARADVTGLDTDGPKWQGWTLTGQVLCNDDLYRHTVCTQYTAAVNVQYYDSKCKRLH